MVGIEAETRGLRQTVYIRRTEQVNGGIYSVEFDQFADRKAF
jgi:branched-chain amino acid transport system substrate-binding protein